MSNVKVVGRRALIGWSGFIGSNLNEKGRWTDYYSSRDIADLEGHYHTIVCAAPGARKWWANLHPEADMDNIMRLEEALMFATADNFVLISTIDAENPTTEYGRNRNALEHYVMNTFHNAAVVRLPGLFGEGLKKNVLHDLLHGRSTWGNMDDVYQWFPVELVWSAIAQGRVSPRDGDLSPTIHNITTEAFPLRDLLHLFPNMCTLLRGGPPVDYTRPNVNWSDKKHIIRKIEQWVAKERAL
jgi:hypothetical protein